MGGILSCLAGQAGFCVTSAACNACCQSCGLGSSVATRIAYGVVFFLFTLLAWVMLTPWAEQELLKVERLTTGLSGGFVRADLSNMIGVLGVFRVCWAMTTFFSLMAVLMIGVSSGKDPRRGLQNGWWAIKVGIIAGLLIGAFYIPNTFFHGWSIVGIVGSSIFILIQLVLLIDFAYFWQEYWCQKWEESDNNGWFILLLSCTFGLFAASIVMTVLMFVYFTGPAGCGLTKFFISFNLILSFIVSALSIMPFVHEENPNTGLLQSATIVCYSTYLVFSAVANVPGDECSRFGSETSPFTTFISVLGGIFTVIAIAYSTIRTAEKSSMNALGMQTDDDDEPMLEMGYNGDEDGDDESDTTHYSWSFFHFTFALASLYIMELLTNWGTVTINTSTEETLQIGVGWGSVWVKIISSWIALLLYGWTIIAPIVFKDRSFY